MSETTWELRVSRAELLSAIAGPTDRVTYKSVKVEIKYNWPIVRLAQLKPNYKRMLKTENETKIIFGVDAGVILTIVQFYGAF